MSRGRKLIIVGLVLAVGLALAWPFRKTDEAKNYDSVAEIPAITSPEIANGGAAKRPTLQAPQLGAPTPHVVAKMTSLSDSDRPSTTEPSAASFDLANHPALAATPIRRAASPVTPPVPPTQQSAPATTPTARPQSAPAGSRPAYPTVDAQQSFDVAGEQPEEVRHVVQNHDTLEKLAKRYLGDEGRALEIFDLNRDVLDNPHLLPINAELRIPADARVTLE